MGVGGPDFISGALRAVVPAAINWGFGNWFGGQANERLNPVMSGLRDILTPAQRVPAGNAPTDINFAPGAAGAEYFREAGIGSGGPNSYNVPSAPGQADLAGAMYQGAANRYEASQEYEDRLMGQVGNYAETLGQGINEYQQGMSNVRNARDQGMDLMSQFYDQGQNVLSQASNISRENMGLAMEAINTRVNEFLTEANNNIDQMYAMRGEDLEALADRTAMLLNSTTAANEMQRRAAHSQIDGNPNIPMGAREGMKQRVDFAQGMKTANMATDIMASETERHTAVRTSYGSMISNTLSSMNSALGGVMQGAIGGTVNAITADTYAQADLAKTSADLGRAFGGMMSDYLAHTTSMEEGIRSTMVGYATAGQMDMFGMLSSIPVTYFDMSGEMGAMVQFGLGMNSAELNDSVQRLNAEMSAYGMEANVSMPFYGNAANMFNQSYSTQWGDSQGGGQGQESSWISGAAGVASAAIGAFASDQGVKAPYSQSDAAAASSYKPSANANQTYQNYNPSNPNMQCDEAVKEAYQVVDHNAILDSVNKMSVTEWQYKFQPGVKHIGPMSQEFHRLFGVGDTDKLIPVVDAFGVCLSAIKALSQKVAELEKQLESK